MGRYETPDYEVLKNKDEFELRKYDAFYIVEYDNESDPMINEGFRTLFSYISSNNNESKKISMTVPVIEEMHDNKMSMAFVVPKALWEKTPIPNSKNLSIKKFEEGLYAAIYYRGNSNKKIESSQKDKLKQWVNSNDWEISSEFMLFLYNPPFIPGIFKRNEILVKIEKL
ncbi:MAG: heme-binding protein [Tissierellales bacterium]|nr:heme-binding protein [Tissierellales bacterium]MBN2826790.1 heme-binding protein [Tissierellales bacterium]